MKKTLIVAFLLFTIGAVAQTTFESEYVKDGKSFELTIPEGFYKLKFPDEVPGYFFTQDQNQTMDDIEDGPTTDGLILGYMPIPTDEMESMSIEDLSEVILEEMGEIEQIKSGPEIVHSNGVDFALATLVIEDIDDFLPYVGLHVAVTRFEEYIIIMGTMVIKEENMKAMKAIRDELYGTFKIVQTDRENKLRDSDMFETAEEGYFDNSEFPTKLSYETTFLSYEDENTFWRENDSGGYPELLIASDYINVDGALEGQIKVFSAGPFANYNSTKDMVEAFDAVFPEHMIRSIEADEKIPVSTTFTKYKFLPGTKAETKVEAIYSTLIADELVFLVVEKTSAASEGFMSSYEKAVLSLEVFEQEELLINKPHGDMPPAEAPDFDRN